MNHGCTPTQRYNSVNDTGLKSNDYTHLSCRYIFKKQEQICCESRIWDVLLQYTLFKTLCLSFRFSFHPQG